MTCCFARKRGFLTKTSETCDSQTLWESHHSQQLFLSSKSRVKWSDGNCEYVFRLCSFFWGGLRGLLRITRKWKMTGSCLLHNALHYHGLMTDWGFRTTPLSLADYIMRTASRTFLGWIFNIVLWAPPKAWNRECCVPFQEYIWSLSRRKSI